LITLKIEGNAEIAFKKLLQ